MLLRKVVMVALVAGPLAWAPSAAEAQARGLDRAIQASLQSREAPGATKHQATKRAKNMPPGIARRHGDGPLPPGIQRTRPPAPEPEPEPQPEPEPEPEPQPDTGGTECIGGILFVGGVPTGPC